MKRRASDAPLYDRCQAAAHPRDNETVIHRIDEAGTLGTAVHKACAAIVTNEDVSYMAIIAKYDLGPKASQDFARMVAAFRQWWAAARQYFPYPQAEVFMEHGDLSGHCDIIAMDGETVRIPDVKTTRLEDVDYLPQGMDYMWLASRTGPYSSGKNYQFIQVFVRDWTSQVSELYTKDELNIWHEDLERRIRNWDGKTYCAGGHCYYCGRSGTCPGLRSELVTTAWRPLQSANAETMETALALLADGECVDMWERIGVAIKFLTRAREVIKLRAFASERVLAGEQRELRFCEETYRTIRPMQAWPILTEYLSEEQLAEAVKISKNTVMDMVGAEASRGMKGKVRKALETKLEQAGALAEKTRIMPRIKRIAAAPEKQIEGAD